MGTATITESVAPPAAPLKQTDERRRVERLPGVHLRIKLGDPLFLRLLCVGQRYEAKVVGLEPFAYCIVQLRLPQDTLSKLTTNPNAVAQISSGGALFGFRTEVVNRVTQPAPLLFLTYPDTVERLLLRRGVRVDVSVPGSIHGSFGDLDVLLTDLAPTGCRFSARTTLKSPLRTLKPGERLVLRCDLGSGPPLIAPVEMRRMDEQHGRVTIGCEFVDMAEEGAQQLDNFIQRMRLLVDG